MNIQIPIVVTFVAYTILMLYIGFYFYRTNNNTLDYFLGNRNIGPITSALSAGASDMSGWLLLGLPGALYVSGFVEGYIAIGLTIGAFINWKFVARRLRVYTEMTHSITIPDYFEFRFQDNSRILRLISAFVILIFFTIYISSGLVGASKLFESVFNINYTVALGVGLLIIVAYTFLGGYSAVCITDLIQGILMMLALIIVPLVMLYELGGFGNAFSLIASVKPEVLDFGFGAGVVAIISSFAWGLGYFGQPHILTRFMSIKSTNDISLATKVGISWMIISLLGAIFIGLLGVAYVAKFDLNLKDPEKIFIVMSTLLFNPWIAGILLSAILAAIMSTASSQLLVSSSAIIEDFYQKIFKQNECPRTMLLSRISVLIVSLIAFFISLDSSSKVLSIVAYAWAGFGASFGSVILFSLFWRDMSRIGAIAGMLTGAIVVVFYKNIFSAYLPIYEIVPGFILASLAIIVFSLMFPARLNVKASFMEMTKKLQ